MIEMLHQLQKENAELKRVADELLNAMEDFPTWPPNVEKWANELCKLIEQPVIIQCVSYDHSADGPIV